MNRGINFAYLLHHCRSVVGACIVRHPNLLNGVRLRYNRFNTLSQVLRLIVRPDAHSDSLRTVRPGRFLRPG